MTTDSFGTVIPFQHGSAPAAPRYVLPQDEQAEQALLGALLQDNRILEKFGEFLRPTHFAVPVHGRIYEAVTKLIDRGQQANAVSLKAYFQADTDLAHLGGGEYLADLLGAVVTVRSAPDFAAQIRDCYLRRELITHSDETICEAQTHEIETSATSLIEAAEARLFKLAEEASGAENRTISLFGAAKLSLASAEAAWKRDGALVGVTMGLRDMDHLLGGLRAPDLVILAGRPSQGKTALATNIALAAASAYRRSSGKDGAAVGFFSLEMSAEQLATRIMAEGAEVASNLILKGDIQESQFRRVAAATYRLEDIPLMIDDTPALSISQVRARARRLKRQFGLGLIVVDYLQLLRASSKQADNRVLQVTEITSGLKAIAKELSVPVLALSQLSRKVEERDDKRPQLSDLRESGSIEQDADIVMFVFREEYYLEREEPTSLKYPDREKYNDAWTKWDQRCKEAHGTAEVIIGKNRHGPIGTVKLYFDGSLTRFSDLAEGRGCA